MVKRKRTSSFGSRKRFKSSRAFRRRLRPRFGRRRKGRVQIHRFKRTWSTVVNQATGGAWTAGVLTFKLNDVPDSANFMALYEQYRITGVKVVFDFNRGLSNVGDSGIVNYGTAEATNLTPSGYGHNPRLFTTLDFNDSTAPTSAADFYDDEYARIHHVTPTRTIFKRYLVPRILNHTALSYNTLAPPRQWLESETGSGQIHHGLKYAIEDNAPYTSMRIEMTYYLQFRRSQ